MLLSALAAACLAAGGDTTRLAAKAARTGEAAKAVTGTAAEQPLSWFASSITQGNSDLLWTLRDAFERAEPALQVEVIPLPPSTDSMRATLETVLHARASQPDVFLGDVIWPAEFGQRGDAAALDELLGRGFFDRFPPEIVRSGSYQGHVYAAPFYTEQGLLYYRKDILARNGIAPPATWDQLAAACKRLKDSGEATYQFGWQGSPYEGLTCNWVEYLADKFGPAADSRVFAAQLGTAKAVEALTFMRDLVAPGSGATVDVPVSPADVLGWQELQSIEAMTAGQIAFLRAWNSSWDTIFPDDPPAARAAKIGVAPLPRFADTPGGPADPGFSTAGGWSLYVNPRSAERAAARGFVSWMTDVSAQRILVTQGGLAPADNAVRNDPRIDAPPPLDVARRARIAARPSGDPDYPHITKAVYQNVHLALAGDRTPEEALRSAARQLAALFRSRGGPQPGS